MRKTLIGPMVFKSRRKDSRLYVGSPGYIFVYDLDSDGNASNGRVHYEFDGLNADGISVDIEGNLYAVAKPPGGGPAGTFGATTGVHVISPDGNLLWFIPIRDTVRNIHLPVRI